MRVCTCRVVFNWNLTPGVYPHEKESDLHQSIWPEGFYDVRIPNDGILRSVIAPEQQLKLGVIVRNHVQGSLLLPKGLLRQADPASRKAEWLDGQGTQ